MLSPGAGFWASYKGAHKQARSSSGVFTVSVLGTPQYLGCYKPEAADAGARLYDSLQLLLHGPRADTTFEWSAYTQADIAAAAAVLRKKGVNVKEAVVCARQGRGTSKWIGVGAKVQSTSWCTRITITGKGSKRILVSWYGLPSVAAAAQQADCCLLAVQGLGCTTNFPASQYSQLQLEQAGQHAISKGVDGTQVTASLEAVEKVCFGVRCCDKK
jgi:hypothetical protein